MTQDKSWNSELLCRRLLQVMAAVSLLASCSEQPTPSSTESSSAESTEQKGLKRDLEQMAINPSKTSYKQATAVYMPGKRNPVGNDYLDAANKALKAGDYDAAETLLDEAIKLSPSDGNLYYLRGRARCNSSRLDTTQGALEDLQKAKQLGALNKGGYGYMARIYDGEHQTQKALAILDEGIKLYPQDAELIKARAALRVDQGDKENAKKDYDKLIELDPRNGLIYLLRAQLFEVMGKFEEALKDYDTGAKLSTSSDRLEKLTIARKSRATLLAKMGRFKDAIEEIEKLKIVERDDDLIRFRGDQYASMKMYDKAIADYTKAISMAPDFASATYESRAKAYTAIGKLDLAEADRLAAKKLKETPAEETLYKQKRE